MPVQRGLWVAYLSLNASLVNCFHPLSIKIAPEITTFLENTTTLRHPIGITDNYCNCSWVLLYKALDPINNIIKEAI